MPLLASLKLAQEKGLDLIEIAPTAKPPVARIIGFDKFRYQKEKELKKQKASQKISEMKKIKRSAKEAKKNLETKMRKKEKFLFSKSFLVFLAFIGIFFNSLIFCDAF